MADDQASPPLTPEIDTLVRGQQAERAQAYELAQNYGRDVVRALILLNGGAIVALLTFVGALFSKADPKLSRAAAAMLHEMDIPLTLFGTGLVSAVLAPAVGYLNMTILQSMMLNSFELSHFIQTGFFDARADRLRRWLPITGLAALAFGVFSILLFALGVWKISGALETFWLSSSYQYRE